MDLSSIKPVNSGTVSIADAIAKAKAIAAEKGVSYERPPPSYGAQDPRLYKRQVEELEEQLKKSQVSRKEIQRLRSTLGEAESKNEQNQKAIQELEAEKSKLLRQNHLLREAARKKVLEVQMASLTSVCHMEAKATDGYVHGLVHLMRYAHLLPSASVKQLGHHVDSCRAFRAALEEFLTRCGEKCRECFETSTCHDLSDFCEPFSEKRPTLPVSSLEAIMPVVSALVKDAEPYG